MKTLHPNVFGGILNDRDEPRARGAGRAARDSDDLDGRREPLPVRGDGRERGRDAAGGDRADRHRRRLAAARRGEELRPRHRAERSLAVRRVHRRAAASGGLDAATRRRYATRAFERTAEYDSAIARYLESGLLANELPGSLALTIPIEQPLRYGENPQDRAAFYLAREAQLPEQLGGKALSYNNLLDLDATLRLLVRARARVRRTGSTTLPRSEPRSVRAAIVKHTVPCGVAERATVADAVREALEADPVSAYGGIIAVDARDRRAGGRAPGRVFPRDRRGAGVRRRPRSRGCGGRRTCASCATSRGRPNGSPRELRVRSALGGVLAEDDDPQAPAERWTVVSRRRPIAGRMARSDLRLGRRAPREIERRRDRARRRLARHLRRPNEPRQRGADRGAPRRTITRAAPPARATGSSRSPTACSPPPTRAARAVIAPQGSIRDAEVIAAADERGIALVFSTYRFFLH